MCKTCCRAGSYTSKMACSGCSGCVDLTLKYVQSRSAVSKQHAFQDMRTCSRTMQDVYAYALNMCNTRLSRYGLPLMRMATSCLP